ncbi:MAG: nitroreductase family protein [Microbacteriaceae bacterium]
MSALSSARLAVTDSTLLPPIAARWSPRAFDPRATLDDDTVDTLLEAARWAPSASNTQPWRFIVGRRGSAEFDAIVTGLLGFNQAWAPRASALIVSLTETHDSHGNPYRWGAYDVGQAVAHLAIQAVSDGLAVHQMGGFDAAILRSAFDLPESLVPLSVTAVGRHGDATDLPESLQQREAAPRARKPLDELVVVRS